MAKKVRRVKRNPKALHVIRTPSGVRYMRGGKFVSAASAKRSRVAKSRSRRRVKKNSRSGGVVYTSPAEVRAFEAQAAPRRRARRAGKTYTSRSVVRFRRRRATRKASTKRRAAPKRRSRVTKRRSRTVAKRRISAATRAKLRRAGKKGARVRKARKAARRAAATKSNPRRRRRRRTVRANPAPRRRRRRRRVTARLKTWFKKTARRKGKRVRRTVSGLKVYLRSRRGRKGRYKGYRIRRRRNRKGAYRYNLVRSNPGSVAGLKKALVQGALFWAGLTGMKAAASWVKTKLASQTWLAGLPAGVASLLPAGALLAGSVFLLPKVLKGKHGQVLGAIQMGAAASLVDAAFKAFVLPQLQTSAPALAAHLSDFGAFGNYNVSVPLAEYVDYDNRLSEYVEYDNRYSGMDVSEGLAADDMAFIQSGGAGGVFAQTSFGWG